MEDRRREQRAWLKIADQLWDWQAEQTVKPNHDMFKTMHDFSQL
jgi:hypothetical protein